MNRTRPSKRLSSGFTLIELMIVVAIIGILSVVALPSYKSYVLKSRRTDAMTALTQTQVILERCYAQNFSYNATCAALPTFPLTSPGGYYTVTLPTQTATTYTLTATPKGAQAADTTCATMSIDQTNLKSAANTGSSPQSICWNP